jgi:hypothetical protein
VVRQEVEETDSKDGSLDDKIQKLQVCLPFVLVPSCCSLLTDSHSCLCCFVRAQDENEELRKVIEVSALVC